MGSSARTPGDATRSDNRLALVDQAFYAGHQAADQHEVMQVVWMYERDVNVDGLRRFHRNLAQGLLGRRIERSALPFGRYRWVSDGQPSALDIAERARPRAELVAWLDECAQLTIDPERGPGWRLSVLPLEDGSTAVSLVMSHYVMDGIGGVVAVAYAVLDDTSTHDYPPPQSRPRLRAVFEDIGQAVRDVPDAAKALVAASREARRRSKETARSQRPQPVTAPAQDRDTPAVMPGVWIRTDLDAWESRAQELGGAGGTLAAALTARLDQNMGRWHGGDHAVKIVLVVGDRSEGDTRAVAVSFAKASIVPDGLTTDLRHARAAVKRALTARQEALDETQMFIALTPYTPKSVWRQLVNYALRDPDQPAVFSNLGEVGSIVLSPDGAACDYAWFRGTRQHLTREGLERMGSQLHLFFGYGVAINKVGIQISAYQPGSITTKAELLELASRTLSEFGLTGQID